MDRELGEASVPPSHLLSAACCESYTGTDLPADLLALARIRFLQDRWRGVEGNLQVPRCVVWLAVSQASVLCTLNMFA